jgi:hypothetical protein
MKKLLLLLFVPLVGCEMINEDEVQPMHRYMITIKGDYIGDINYFDFKTQKQVHIFNYSANHRDFIQIVDTIAPELGMGVSAKDGGGWDGERLRIEFSKDGVLKFDTAFVKCCMGQTISIHKKM